MKRHAGSRVTHLRVAALASLGGGVATLALAAAPAGAAAAKRTPPYYASIAPAKARMRSGPARTYPVSWLYQRADLPVRVVAVFKEWRKIADPDGAEGWMQGNMVAERRTAVVHGGQAVAMLDRPVPGAKLLWRAAPGVVGRISECAGGWCRFDVKGQAGYVQISGLWGVDPGETVP
jgi:SH3-like domain-containing protein